MITTIFAVIGVVAFVGVVIVLGVGWLINDMGKRGDLP